MFNLPDPTKLQMLAVLFDRVDADQKEKGIETTPEMQDHLRVWAKNMEELISMFSSLKETTTYDEDGNALKFKEKTVLELLTMIREYKFEN